MTSILDISEKEYKIISGKKIPKNDADISRKRWIFISEKEDFYFPKRGYLFPKKVLEISEKRFPKKDFRKRVYFYFRKKISEKDGGNFRKEMRADLIELQNAK